MEYRNICMICLESKKVLSNISYMNSPEICLRLKLEKCIPDIDWKNDYSICSNCTANLNNAYSFRELCIKTEHIRVELWEKIVKFQMEQNSNSEVCIKNTTNPYIIRNLNCGKSILNENDSIEQSNETFEKPVDFYCVYCNKTYAHKNALMEHLKNCNLMICNEIDNPQETNKEIAINQSQNIITQPLKKCISNENKPDTPKEIKEEDEPTEIEKVQTLEYEINIPNDIKKEADSVVYTESNSLENDELNQCNICGTSFNNKYLLKRHKKNVHAIEKNFKCDQCPSSFVSSVYLNAHKKYHARDRQHVCLFCGKRFITASDLYHHEKTHQNKRAYKCAECKKAFNNASDLHKHKICVHMDKNLWKYSCEYCNRRFPLKTNLDSHIKTHTGEKNFPCHLCDKKCISRSALTRHLESHTNVKSFKCEMCNLSYKYKKSLKIHCVKSHGVGEFKIPDKEKKYFCHLCPKTYYANSKLEKHIRSHTGDKPFKCPRCDKCFIDKSYIKQHLRLAHKEDV